MQRPWDRQELGAFKEPTDGHIVESVDQRAEWYQVRMERY